ncbi:centromere protein I-like [Macrosteles quadrilineatus]|uniref:centromere protein I-like n=1 Tax=Macrosteles quadrilineatus TaxID=74068 RepID=UPI0023E0B506|nr:centromere protein I-like [Macrosteles quadrilineatus]
MASRMSDDTFVEEVPKFVKLIESSTAKGSLASTIKEIISDVFNVSVERGLNDEECSMLLNLFCKGSISMSDKFKLLQNIVPKKQIPDAATRQFMVWFISRFRRDENFSFAPSARILQWIIGLLEHNLVNSKEIYIFYLDFFDMLRPPLIPYVSKLLCILTKPDDVTSQTVLTLWDHIGDESNKYLLAVVKVFKGYKPHLMVEDVKDVDVVKVLKSVPQSMDSIMRVREINSRGPCMPKSTLGLREVPTSNHSYFNDENKISSLIPLPTYNFEGIDKFKACYPDSVEQAGRRFSKVPIPQNVMALLHNDVGFFTLMYQGIELQFRLQNILLQTLQNVLIYKEFKSTEEDAELLLRRVCCLETFLQQGLPAVTLFLSGYLLNWDGVDHRHSIMNLIEWATFHSFKELACNILRPLHVLFVTNTVNMRKKIIQMLTNLIRNMFADVYRVQQGIPFPFLKRGPKWTNEPETMLQSLVSWTENLIMLGLTLERDSSSLLMESIQFYEMINVLEAASGLPLFTVVSEGVVLQSLLSQNPNTIISICRLLLRYHKEFLPKLRVEQPRFYKHCEDKIELTANYAQRIIYFLQNGQVVLPRKQNGAVVRDVVDMNLSEGVESLCLTSHLCFLTTYVSFETKKNFLSLSHPGDRKKSLELASLHLREIKEFINFFFPSIPEARD